MRLRPGKRPRAPLDHAAPAAEPAASSSDEGSTASAEGADTPSTPRAVRLRGRRRLMDTQGSVASSTGSAEPGGLLTGSQPRSRGRPARGRVPGSAVRLPHELGQEPGHSGKRQRTARRGTPLQQVTLRGAPPAKATGPPVACMPATAGSARGGSRRLQGLQRERRITVPGPALLLANPPSARQQALAEQQAVAGRQRGGQGQSLRQQAAQKAAAQQGQAAPAAGTEAQQQAAAQHPRRGRRRAQGPHATPELPAAEPGSFHAVAASYIPSGPQPLGSTPHATGHSVDVLAGTHTAAARPAKSPPRPSSSPAPTGMHALPACSEQACLPEACSDAYRLLPALCVSTQDAPSGLAPSEHGLGSLDSSCLATSALAAHRPAQSSVAAAAATAAVCSSTDDEDSDSSDAGADEAAAGLPGQADAQRRAEEDAVLQQADRVFPCWRDLIRPPAPEPERPLCGWDYMLQESNWLAIDMAQERLWKRAVALALAHGCADPAHRAGMRRTQQGAAARAAAVDQEAELEEELEQHHQHLDGAAGLLQAQAAVDRASLFGAPPQTSGASSSSSSDAGLESDDDASSVATSGGREAATVLTYPASADLPLALESAARAVEEERLIAQAIAQHRQDQAERQLLAEAEQQPGGQLDYYARQLGRLQLRPTTRAEWEQQVHARRLHLGLEPSRAPPAPSSLKGPPALRCNYGPHGPDGTSTKVCANPVCHMKRNAAGGTVTPQWRDGPEGRKTLCNACGTRHARKMKNLLESGRSAARPTAFAQHQRVPTVAVSAPRKRVIA